MPIKKYSEETKAAVIVALLEGQAVSKVAEDYKIPEGTVKSWKYRKANQVAKMEKDATQKKEIGDLLIEYLQQSLQALIAQVQHFKNIEWLSKQSAESAAVLHGVMTDKAIRLLEALGRNEAEE